MTLKLFIFMILTEMVFIINVIIALITAIRRRQILTAMG